MGKGSSAPEPPDPKETSAAQTGTNVATAIANAVLQNPNQTTPWGSLTYSFGNSNIPQIEEVRSYTEGTPAQSSPSGSDNPLFGQLFGGMGVGGSEGSAGGYSTRYSVGGQTFDSYEQAQAYQRSLPGYEEGSNYTWTDPYTGETYTIPRVSVEQSLTEEGQQLQDKNVQTQLNLAGLAEQQSGFLQDYMAQPFSYSPGEYESWAQGLYDQLNSGTIDKNREALESRLLNQGVASGSEAYSRAMQDFTTSQQDSRNKFLLDAYSTGMNTALTERNQPLNEISALLGGSQVQQPTFVNPNISGIPTTDNASIIANDYNARMNQWQQDQAAGGSMLSSLGGLFSGLGNAGIIGGSGSGALLALSDERAKDDKRKIGETEDGLGLYSFKYKGDDRTQIGLMAQDVKKKKPGAVKTLPGGLMAVDYGRALQ